MSTNLYGTSCTPNLGGVQDYYTKAETNSLLGAKANTSTTYTRTYLDAALATIGNTLASLSASQVTSAGLSAALASLQGTIESGVAATYATLADTYTRSEVDSLVAGINLDPDTLLRRTPATTAQNTINPGANNAVALTIRGSSTNPVVSEWRDNTNDRIGYVTNTGRVVFENKLTVGRLVSDGDFSIDASGRRITGVADPIIGTDAVPYSTLQSYVIDFFEDVVRPDPTTVFSLDAGTY
jgi:hypothetical protein